MNTAVGDKDAPVLFVMTHPPSDGMEAWMWRVVQQEAMLHKTDVRIIYLLDGPPENSGGRPSKQQLRDASQRVNREFAESKAHVVVPFGPDACRVTFGDVGEGIFDMRGYVIPSQFFGVMEVESLEQCGVYKQGNAARGVAKGDPKYKWVKRSLAGGYLGTDFKGVVIPVFTLDYVRKQQFACKPAFTEDMRRVKRAAYHELRLVDEGFRFYNTFTTTRGVDNLPVVATDLRNIPLRQIVAVDIETHGVDNEVIDCVSFSDGITTASLKWTTAVRDYLNNLFSDTKRTFIFHNSPFDVPRLVANGVKIPQEVLDRKLFDSMFGAVVLQPDLHKGLGRVSTVFLDVYPWKWSSIKHGDAEFYSAKDSLVTVYLARSEMETMRKVGCYDLFMGTGEHPGPGVMATVPVLTEMAREGIRTDPGIAADMFDSLSVTLLQHEQEWAQKFPGVEPRSNKSVADLLYGTWKLPVQRTAEDGTAVDELALVRLKMYLETVGQHADPRCTPGVFDLLLKLRNANKLLSTYVVPLMGEGSRVYPSYLPAPKDGDSAGSKGVTATGRLASSNPNIQNQPKDVRKLYIPDRPDMAFVQADYKAAELYAIAAMANDDRLIADLTGPDMHSANAARFNTDRKTAKNILYASQYLASPGKVSEILLAQSHQYLPAVECARIINGISEYYFKTTAYKRHLMRLCETQGFIKNPFGRVRFFHGGNSAAGVNYIPQSIVADVLWAVLKPVSDMAKRYGGRITATVHDSILIQVPIHHRADAAREMRAIMGRTFDNVAKDFTIPVSLEAGKAGASWGDLTDYDPEKEYQEGEED